MKGWTITGEELLETRKVEDVDCPLLGSIPAPRVLQNQLDRNLELYIAAKEEMLLKAVQRELRQCSPDSRETVFAVVLFILNVLERDTWRLMYWRKRRDQVN
jgi:maltooligosyltrehalose synthase